MSSTTAKGRKIIITQALPYANASLHLGHILEAVQSDIWSRFQNNSGNECLFFCADDTHGTPVMLKAKEMGIGDDVSVVTGSHYCASENYLAFAKKPGHQALAVKFGEELIKFKDTDEYREILNKYGMNINSCCNPNL